MYSVFNNCAYINGLNGKYDSSVQDYSVRYGRNAIANHLDYLKQYNQEPVEFEPYLENDSFEEKMAKIDKFTQSIKESMDKMPPINFQLQYMPKSQKGYVDYNALMGASYEEMGQRYSISVDEMDKQLNPPEQGYLIPAKCLDINNDNKIDVSEYATTILLSDILSTDSEKYSADNVNGIITNKGENAMLNKHLNGEISGSTYSYLYHYFNLGREKTNFLKDSNNLY